MHRSVEDAYTKSGLAKTASAGHASHFGFTCRKPDTHEPTPAITQHIEPHHARRRYRLVIWLRLYHLRRHPWHYDR